jgi:uncharacterized OB-fold protein
MELDLRNGQAIARCRRGEPDCQCRGVSGAPHGAIRSSWRRKETAPVTAYEKPRPRIGPDNERFWHGRRAHRLMLPTCRACGKPHLPPGPVCPFCFSDDINWQAASGRGRICTWTMVHKAWFPAFKDETPYNVVQVELDEGPRLTSRIVGCGDQKIQIGQRVEVVFDDIDEELSAPHDPASLDQKVFLRLTLGRLPKVPMLLVDFEIDALPSALRRLVTLCRLPKASVVDFEIDALPSALRRLVTLCRLPNASVLVCVTLTESPPPNACAEAVSANVSEIARAAPRTAMVFMTALLSVSLSHRKRD